MRAYVEFQHDLRGFSFQIKKIPCLDIGEVNLRGLPSIPVLDDIGGFPGLQVSHPGKQFSGQQNGRMDQRSEAHPGWGGVS